MTAAPIAFYLCFLVWLAIFTAGVQSLVTWKRLLAIVLIAVALLLPIGDITPLLYLRGVFGDFSVTHTLWALATFVNHVTARPLVPLPVRQKVFLCLLLLPTAAVFYPSALGAVDLDAYRFGFHPQAMLGVLAVIALLCWMIRQYLAVIAIAASVLAWSQQLLESNNLWDYLLDPLLVLYCAVWCLVMVILELARANKAPTPSDTAAT